MRWAKAGHAWGNAKWHLVDPETRTSAYGGTRFTTQCGNYVRFPRTLPEDRRPALARNNVCSRCKKAYIATRPDLQAAFELLNDKKDV